jgi:hypothetical protein
MSNKTAIGRTVFPGRHIYGEEWFKQISQDTTKRAIICEAHEGFDNAIALQRSLGREQLVIAINNLARIELGCAKCSPSWHERFEKTSSKVI